jgi:hypothetical protein
VTDLPTEEAAPASEESPAETENSNLETEK